MRKSSSWALILCAEAFVQSAALSQSRPYDDTATQRPLTQALNYTNPIRITPDGGVKGDLAPIVRIVSPLGDSSVAARENKAGLQNPNGAGFW